MKRRNVGRVSLVAVTIMWVMGMLVLTSGAMESDETPIWARTHCVTPPLGEPLCPPNSPDHPRTTSSSSGTTSTTSTTTTTTTSRTTSSTTTTSSASPSGSRPPSPSGSSSPSGSPSSSPSAIQSYPSTITIESGRGEFLGRVRSDEDACVPGRRVVLKKARAGVDAKVGTTQTNRRGRWHVKVSRKRGRYYAVVQQRSFDRGDVEIRCGRARSKTIRG